MSIWSSVGEDVVGNDGETQVDVDVATATSWNNMIRIAVLGDGIDVDMTLDLAAAERLRDNLGEAIQRVQLSEASRRRPSRGSPAA